MRRRAEAAELALLAQDVATPRPERLALEEGLRRRCRTAVLKTWNARSTATTTNSAKTVNAAMTAAISSDGMGFRGGEKKNEIPRPAWRMTTAMNATRPTSVSFWNCCHARRTNKNVRQPRGPQRAMPSSVDFVFRCFCELQTVTLHADLTMLARLSLALARARAIPLAA